MSKIFLCSQPLLTPTINTFSRPAPSAWCTYVIGRPFQHHWHCMIFSYQQCAGFKESWSHLSPTVTRFLLFGVNTSLSPVSISSTAIPFGDLFIAQDFWTAVCIGTANASFQFLHSTAKYPKWYFKLSLRHTEDKYVWLKRRGVFSVHILFVSILDLRLIFRIWDLAWMVPWWWCCYQWCFGVTV